MTDGEPVTLDALNALDRAHFVAVLGNIYEHGSWAADAAFGARPYRTVKALYEVLKGAVGKVPEAERMALLRGHPDLAGKAARAGNLTRESTGEQGGARLDRLSDGEFEAFQRLNEAYRRKFGFPFVICVRRHSKDSILAQFERRLANDAGAELHAAFAEIDRIAALRLSAAVAGKGPLEIAGRLSTHVLDTHGGRPAAGIAVELSELSADGTSAAIAHGVTNEDGRTPMPLIAGRPVPIGTYELVFAVGDYFRGRGASLADPPFLDRIPVRFAVAEPEGHYHVPLLVTPWSYATYRGS